MKAVILAGGLGSRLRPTTLTIPKPLIRIAGKSIIEHNIDKLRQSGYGDIIITVSPTTHDIYKERLRHVSGIKLVVQEQALGLAHAVESARTLLDPGENFCVYLADNIFEASIPGPEYFDGTFSAKMVLKSVEDPRQLGVALVEEGKITKLIEKPQQHISNLAITGMYLCTPHIWEVIPRLKPSHRGEYEMTDAMDRLISVGPGLKYTTIDGYWYDAGSFKDLLEVNSILVRKSKISHSGYQDSSITDSSIGSGCNISGSRISNSIILDNTSIKYMEVSHCLIGENCKLESSSSLRNAHLGSYSTIVRS